MELVLAAVALIVAGVGLALALSLRNDLRRVQSTISTARREVAQAHEMAESARQTAAQALSAAQAADQGTASLRKEVAELRDELTGLRAAHETPLPPLPRARTGNLEDLRER